MSYENLTTLAEQSGFRKTGRTDEVERLCEAFASTWPDAIRKLEYGRSAEGRPMLALIVSRADPRKVPVLMLQAGIHPGESDGKDAGFIALRELLSGDTALGSTALSALDHIAILFVPAFNTDGHERAGRWNRPNQNGPEETGWRTTAQNLNLNRDYTKAQAPEMQAMLRLLNDWDPLVCADLHVTDGADFEPDVSLQVEPIHQGDPLLYASGTQLRDELIDTLAAQGSMPLPFYPDLAKTDDPASGFQLTIYSPRFSTGYFPARNRFTVLVETHSWKDYATRVRVTRNTIVGLAELVSAHGAKWLGEVRRADAAAAQWGGNDVALAYAAGWREPIGPDGKEKQALGANVSTIDFRGYAYTRTPSPISGALATQYDPKTPQNWRVPYRRHLEPSLVVKAPLGGYVVAGGFAQEVGQKLALHGISYEPFAAAGVTTEVETFRADRAAFSGGPFEGRMRVTLEGAWRPEAVGISPGSIFVPIRQARARLLMALLEPLAPDSLAAWGFFNGCFEQKEHLEPYVAEKLARDMLASDPKLAAQFEHKLDTDAAFAGSAVARLEFFHRRHASWDSRFNLYPVYRLGRKR